MRIVNKRRSNGNLKILGEMHKKQKKKQRKQVSRAKYTTFLHSDSKFLVIKLIKRNQSSVLDISLYTYLSDMILRSQK